MGFGLTVVLIILIICVSTLSGIYMYLCAENEVKIFTNPRYEERISELEKSVKELKEKK